jgi:hypothetical protein
MSMKEFGVENMRTNTKVSSKRKSIDKAATDPKTLAQNKHRMGIKVVNPVANRKRRTVKNLDEDTSAIDQDDLSLDDVVVHNDLWMLKYGINEKGIGKILLPPSLSILLQSDQVSIMPSAGGLFIRSI